MLQVATGLAFFAVFFVAWLGLGLPFFEHGGFDAAYPGLKALCVTLGLFAIAQAMAYRIFRRGAKAAGASASQ